MNYDRRAIARSLKSPEQVSFPEYWNGMTVQSLGAAQTGLDEDIGGYTFQVEPNIEYNAVPVYPDGLPLKEVVEAVKSEGWTPRGLLTGGQGTTPMLLVSRNL